MHHCKTSVRLVCLALLSWSAVCQGKPTARNSQRMSPPPELPGHWESMARRDLLVASSEQQLRTSHHPAKNAIMFLGDGMGMASIAAGRILKGQLNGKIGGEEEILAFERFPHIGLAKTYNTDMQTPDSAGTATAFLCGVKAKSGTLGVNDLALAKNCTSLVKATHVYSFLTEAQQQGKSVGIVTTTRITHATPGAAYSHTVWRDWEDDTKRDNDVPDEAARSSCPDIAQQMIDNAINYTVLFGGGRLNFLPKNEATIDPVEGKQVNGRRSDSVNLIELWKQRQAALGRRAEYIEDRKHLENVPLDSDAYLGLFAMNHLSYVLDNKPDHMQPTLEEMTRKAIAILKRNPKGFALLVEGGLIDRAHHNNLAKKAMHELVAFDRAIQAAGKMISSRDTLSVVTADHSHVFSIGGWTRRGQPLFGKVDFTLDGKQDSKGQTLSLDGMPYTSLFYGDGPSAVANGTRANITDTDTEDSGYAQQALVKFPSESHGSEDVPIYASGPGAHLIHTTHEQSYIAHVIKHSLCIGVYAAQGFCLGD